MTTATRAVTFTPLRLDGTGAPTVASGYYLIEPTSAYGDGAGRVEVLGFQVDIAGGPVTVDLPVTPADNAWVLKVVGTFRGAGGTRTTTEYVEIPSGSGTLNFEDLIRVDLLTLHPLPVVASREYVATIGDGLHSTFTVSHSVGSVNTRVDVINIATGQTAYPVVQRTDTDTLYLDFGTTIPAVNAYRVLIAKVG